MFFRFITNHVSEGPTNKQTDRIATTKTALALLRRAVIKQYNPKNQRTTPTDNKQLHVFTSNLSADEIPELDRIPKCGVGALYP